MNDNTYNGWTNWATWNLKLWLDNEEGLYREVMRMVDRAIDVDRLEDALKGYAIEIFPDGTPDMDSGTELFDVDFNEIAQSLWDDKEQDNA